MNDEPRRRVLLAWLLILLEGSLGLLAVALAAWLDLPLGWRWSWTDAALGLAACLPMMLLFWTCLRLPFGPLARIRRIAEELIRPLFQDWRLAELALLALLAGVGEELLFRGVLQGGLGQRLDTAAAVAIAGVVFGVLHALTFTYAVFATLMGAYLGVLWVATGNLLAPVLAHGLYDFAALVYLIYSPPAPGGRGE